jgi:hypothetical protein
MLLSGAQSIAWGVYQCHIMTHEQVASKNSLSVGDSDIQQEPPAFLQIYVANINTPSAGSAYTSILAKCAPYRRLADYTQILMSSSPASFGLFEVPVSLFLQLWLRVKDHRTSSIDGVILGLTNRFLLCSSLPLKSFLKATSRASWLPNHTKCFRDEDRAMAQEVVRSVCYLFYPLLAHF